MLSITADYALRATLVLARRMGEGPVRVEEIATATGAPRNYLSKTLHALTKAGIVRSARGPHGGFTLALAPDALSLAQVIDCFDAPRPSPRCLLGSGPCDPARPCAAHSRWTAILAARRAALATTTVADLLGDGRQPRRLEAGAPAVPAVLEVPAVSSAA